MHGAAHLLATSASLTLSKGRVDPNTGLPELKLALANIHIETAELAHKHLQLFRL